MSSLVLMVGKVEKILTRETAEKLKAEGYSFQHSQNGETAIERIQAAKPDLVITELELPGSISGWDLFHKVRNLDFQKRIAFIFITNNFSMKDKMQALFIGARAYLATPVNQEELVDEMRKAIQAARATTKISKKVTLKGNLQNIPLSDIFQMVSNYKKSGELIVKNPNHPKITCLNGEIVDAKWQDRHGVEAFYKIVALDKGDFEFAEYIPSVQQRTIQQDWVSLLMDGLRGRDEFQIFKQKWLKDLDQDELEFAQDLILMGYLTREQLESLMIHKDPFKKLWNLVMDHNLLDDGHCISMVETIRKERENLEKAKERISDRLQQSFEAKKSKSTIKSPSPLSGTGNIAEESTETMMMRLEYLMSKSPSSKSGTEGVSENIFNRLLLSLSLVSPEDMRKCVNIQVQKKLMGENVPLQAIFVEQGILDEKTIERVLHIENPRGESLIPGYKVSHLLGEGGLAAVYLAFDEKTGEKRAIKIFAPPSSDTSTTVVRFIQECEVIKGFNHPNIVKAYDFGEFYGLYYIVMEYLEGKTLAEMIIEKGGLAEKDALNVIEQVALGLKQVWEKGIIHRDIKPENIMIGRDFIKICDFGLAKALDSDLSLTQAGTLVGTPHYMSPEQLSNEPVDYRTDIYSLGVVLYVSLTAHLPFAATTTMALTQAHLNAPPPLPAKFNVNVSNSTVAFMFKMLSKHKEDRCKSAEEFFENIERAKKGKMPLGGVRFFKEKKKKRNRVIASILLIVLLAVGIGYYIQETRINAIKLKKQQVGKLKKQLQSDWKKWVKNSEKLKKRFQDFNNNITTFSNQYKEILKKKNIREKLASFENLEEKILNIQTIGKQLQVEGREIQNRLVRLVKEIHHLLEEGQKLNLSMNLENDLKIAPQKKSWATQWKNFQKTLKKALSLASEYKKQLKILKKEYQKYTQILTAKTQQKELLKRFSLQKNRFFRSMEKMDFHFAQGILDQMEVDFASIPEVQDLSKKFKLLQAVKRGGEDKDLEKIKDGARVLSSDPKFKPYFYRLFWEMLKENRLLPFGVSLLEYFISMGEKSYGYLARFLSREPSHRWFQNLCEKIPYGKVKRFLSFMTHQNNQLKKLAQQLQTFYWLLSSIPQLPRNERKVASFATSQKEIFLQSFHHLRQKEKLKVIKALPQLKEKQLSSLLIYELSKTHESEVLIFLAKIFQNPTIDLEDRIIQKYLKISDKRIRKTFVTSMGKRKDWKSLAQALMDQDREVRNMAFRFFENSANTTSLKILAEILDNLPVDVKIKGIQLLGRKKAAWSVNKIGKVLLNAIDKNVQKSAIQSLAYIGNSKALQILFEKAKNAYSDEIEEQVVKALEKIGTRETIQLLIKMVKEGIAREKATNALITLQDKSIPLLVEALSSSSSSKQIVLLDVLEKIGGPAVISLGNLLVQSRNISLQKRIIRTLGNIGDRRAIPYLEKVQNNRSLRWTVRSALKRLK